MKGFLNLKQTEEKRREILSEEIYKPLLKQLDAMYAEASGEPVKSLSYSKFKLFWETGNRSIYEGDYFNRRKLLASAFMKFYLYENDEYKKVLEDIIWAICDEYTWVLPAHINEDLWGKEDPADIDLFSAETAEALSEIVYLLGDRLDRAVLMRIKSQIYKRIIIPFESGSFSWETREMNWAAVCGGCVGMTYILLAPERFKAQQSRLRNIMSCFLRGFGSDGVCREGLNYWTYGFGYFIYYAQMAYELTHGTENLFDNPVVKKTAAFQQACFLSGNTIISFADGARTHLFNGGLTSFLVGLYPDAVSVPNNKYLAPLVRDHCYRFAHFTRNFFWLAAAEASAETAEQHEIYYADSEWFILKNRSYGFAAKGGTNDEPHNHNDIGSFIIALNGTQPLCDIGCGEYTKDYFSDRRYELLCNRSGGHSLPIIDGKEQSEGADRKAVILLADGGRFSLDISKAYNIQGLSQAVRTFTCLQNSVTLTDVFNFSDGKPHSITERFVSLCKPCGCSDGIRLGSVILKSAEKPEITAEIIKDHHGCDLTVYLVDYHLKSSGFEIRFDII